MRRGTFAAQVNEIPGVMRGLGLLQEHNRFPAYRELTPSAFRGLRYVEIWKKCFAKGLYDFRLTDDSLLQLRGGFSPLRLSYAFLESPYLPVVDFETFLDQERLARGEEASDYDIIRDHELMVAAARDCVTPLRYDYAPEDYREAMHPASHVHFGHGNDIRVGTRRILRPLSFVLFVIRQRYPACWSTFVSGQRAEVLCRNVSQNLDAVEGTVFGRMDSWEMYLS